MVERRDEQELFISCILKEDSTMKLSTMYAIVTIIILAIIEGAGQIFGSDMYSESSIFIISLIMLFAEGYVVKTALEKYHVAAKNEEEK